MSSSKSEATLSVSGVGATKVLSALAFLEASRRCSKRKDRLELFVPLFKKTIISFHGTSFSLDEMQQQLYEFSGLAFPPTVTQTILGRCCRDGIIKKENGKYFALHPGKITFSEIDDGSEELKTKLDALLKKAESYIEANTSELSASRSVLLSELVHYLEKTFSDQALSEGSGQKNEELIPDNIWIRFFAQSVEDDPEVTAILQSFIRGVIVYNAAFFPGFTSSTPSFKNFIVFIDSPLLCMAIGISSVEKQNYVIETLNLLKKAGVVCRVLEPTVEEVRGILATMENKMGLFPEKESPESFSRCAKKRGLTREDIYELRNCLEEVIEEDLDLDIVSTYTRERQYVGDEEKLAQRLADKDDKGSSWSKRVTHDVNCVGEILRLRKGCASKNLQNAKAVMVTFSRRTIRNVKLWWIHDENHPEDSIPPMLSLESLANYVWLNNPSLNITDIQNELVLITCATALSPSPSVWEAYVNRVRQMVDGGSMTEERAAIILYRSDIDSILHHVEKKAPKPSSADFDRTTEVALQEAARPYLEKQKQSHNEEISRMKQDSLDQEKRRLAESRQQKERIVELERQLQESEEARLLEARKLGATLAWIATILASVVAIVIVFVILRLLTGGFYDDGSFNTAGIISIFLSAITAIPLVGSIRKIQQWFSSLILKRLIG